jgi:hypothetical protein
MKMPTAILQEQYEHRWVREQERIIDAHRRARVTEWAWLRWKRRMLWAGFTALGFTCVIFGLWIRS